MTIIHGGYIVGYPLGGMTWHHLNYVLGLTELGHDVWFYEFGAWPPYNPKTRCSEWDETYGIAYIDAQFKAYGLPPKWCYEFPDGRTFNLSRDELQSLFARADLMICVSGITPLHAIEPRPRKLLVIDTDPVFTQIRMSGNEELLNYYKQFDACATFGRLIGARDRPLPTHGIDWIPTNQPIALRHWPVRSMESNAFTTIGKWEHSTDRHLEFDGKQYLSSKAVEWEKVIDVPRRTRWQMSLAMQMMPPEQVERFSAHGWRMVDPESASRDCRAYQNFIGDSAGEFTVTKQIYAQLLSGWFSDRSAAYLASGRPVVTQSSGFEQWLPTGEGLFAFEDIDQAAAALQTIASDPPRHTAAARRIAERHFDSRKVLGELLDRVM
jgi:hypothetical protein